MQIRSPSPFAYWGDVCGHVFPVVPAPTTKGTRTSGDGGCPITRGSHHFTGRPLYGKITKVNEETIEVEIADGVIIRQVKSMVLALDTKPEPVKKKAPAKAASKSARQKQPQKQPPASRERLRPKQTTTPKILWFRSPPGRVSLS